MENSPVKETSEFTSEGPAAVGRRGFFAIVIGLIGTSIAAVLSAIAGRYALAPALSPPEASQWAEAGPVAEVLKGQPVKLHVLVSQNAGWGRFHSSRPVWAVRKGEGITVFSAVCPHLGCAVNHAAGGFICACHGSAWDTEGRKLGGPTPRGMDTLEHRIADGVLQVKYESFRQGTAHKETVS